MLIDKEALRAGLDAIEDCAANEDNGHRRTSLWAAYTILWNIYTLNINLGYDNIVLEIE